MTRARSVCSYIRKVSLAAIMLSVTQHQAGAQDSAIIHPYQDLSHGKADNGSIARFY